MFEPYLYLKNVPKDRRRDDEVLVIRIPTPARPRINLRPFLSLLLVLGGIFLVTSQIVLPFLQTTPERPLLKPLVEVEAATTGLEPFVFRELAAPTASPSDESVPADRADKTDNNIPTVFYLTVPKLGIERAEVQTNSSSLSPDERLGHYPGSSLPGRVGNSFIYGHSALPLFFNVKDYRTIFTHLNDLEDGDEILVEFGSEYYKYRVFKKVVLNPEDVKPLQPLSPRFLQQSYLTLMTCVPPGLKTKRLLVHARLVL